MIQQWHSKAIRSRRVAISDNFNRTDAGSLGANWSEVVTQGSGFEISSNTVRLTTGIGNVVAIHQTQTKTINQYSKFKILYKETDVVYGWVFRYLNSSSPFYLLELNGNAPGTLIWYSCPDTGMAGSAIATTALAHSINDTIGVTIAGTGNDTVVRFWKNPTANYPKSATEWDDGDTTPDVAITDNPATAADTGRYLGIDCNQYANNLFAIDDFFGGDAP